jgi:hypothetical protein
MKIYLALIVQQLVLISCAFNKFENDECTSAFTGDGGVCVEAKYCPEFKTNRNQLAICSFKRKVPIVCCPSLSVGVKNGGGGEIKRRISAESKPIVIISCLH